MVDNRDLHRRIMPASTARHAVRVRSTQRDRAIMCAMGSAPSTAPWLLEPARRRYAWGSPTALFELLREQPDGEPLAELWYGAHPAGAAVVAAAGGAGLDELIAADPVAALGERAVQWQGRL